MINVVGLDLSLAATGIAEVRAHELDGEYGFFVRVSSLDTERKRFADHHERLEVIRAHVLTACIDVTLVLIEGLSYGSKGAYFTDNVGLHWVIRQELWQHGIPYAVVPPTTLKKYMTGKGNANKDAMLLAVERKLGNYAQVNNNNEADAFALAAIGLHWMNAPLCKGSVPDPDKWTWCVPKTPSGDADQAPSPDVLRSLHHREDPERRPDL